MRKGALLLVALCCWGGVAMAVPKAGPVYPVAADYPAWTGVSPANRVTGRLLFSPADLRQRVTVIVEFDANKAAEQLEKVGNLVRSNFAAAQVTEIGQNWETLVMPREVLVVFVALNHKGKDFEELKKAIRPKGSQETPGLWNVQSWGGPVYVNITFPGAPNNEGKLPYVYVMGREGKEPLYKGAYDVQTPSKVSQAIGKHKKELAASETVWRPFFGYLKEVKHFPGLEPLIKTGKPLEAFQAKLLKGVVSKDPEVAKEAQMLFDALEQTRDDFIYLASSEIGAAPHVAAFHVAQVVRYWPKMKKSLADVSGKLKLNAEAKPLVKMFPMIMQWADPDFMCKSASDAKKIVQELNKMKKTLEPMKENAKNIAIQNGALILDGMIDELIGTIPTKVPSK